MPGLEAVLRQLAQRCNVAVATSKPFAFAVPVLEALGLDDFFLVVVGPDLATEHEDKAETVGRAIGALPAGARPVMIGDRRYDIAAAHANGIEAIGVLWGIGSESELREAGARTLARDSSELPGLIAGARG